ncbi:MULTISPECIES: DsrE family protein [Pseudomonadota]|jgi:intracellular sulfur oxidation DsrE/DsrF family protein|uniref:DsrE family protein n=3 Tax=Pseudomonadota TaxID=1224 RepID=UPI0008334484|nr:MULTISPECIES: DsrE family protein [Pseudomonadota]|tara:strand:+ start:62289 stop:62858 length:570 start_codon:yes stop_codon:yes gene_type:complete
MHSAVLNQMLGLILLAGLAGTMPVQAQEPMRPGFHAGTVIPEFGPVASAEGHMPIPVEATFSIAFDVSEPGKPGSLNRTIESAARFINMHVEAGVPREAIRIAVVAHGQASFDLTNAATYAAKHDGAANANLAAIATLLQHDVQFILCGQSAAALGIKREQLAPGVKLALSAMTAHAQLQQQGYTLNPF